MVREQPSQLSVLIQIVLLIIFIVSLSICLFLGTLEPMVVFAAIGCAILIIYLIWWLTNNPNYFDSWNETLRSTGNATLTCKNGHSSRVWIDLTGWNSNYEDGFYKNEIIYNVNGHDVRIDSNISPQVCPECGAEWLLPHKHNGHKR
jgi:hypothetical protein